MADTEQRFLYALLSAKRNDQDRFYTQQIPKGVFKIRELEVSWVYRFREKHGRYPSVSLFNNQFSTDPLKKHSDSLNACLQPILDMAMFNSMRDLVSEVKERFDEKKDVSQTLSFFKQKASRLSDYSTDYVDVNFGKSDVVRKEYFELVRKISEGGADLLDTPWPSLNKLVKFMFPGEVTYIAARTNMGKSWVAVKWADHFARKKIPTVIVTKEMTSQAFAKRNEALVFKLPYDKYREGALPPKVMRRWKKERELFVPESYPLYISGDETVEGVGLSQVIAKIEQYRPSVVFIDGAYLIVPEGISKNANRNEKYAYLSSRLKAIAKATNTKIFAVIQMNRLAEKKDGQTKGTLADLYGSDTWAQDADYVLDLYGKRGSNTRTLNLLKARESSIGEFTIEFVLDPYPKFAELSGLGMKAAESNKATVSFKGIS